MTKTIFQLLHYLSYELTSVKPELHLNCHWPTQIKLNQNLILAETLTPACYLHTQ